MTVSWETVWFGIKSMTPAFCQVKCDNSSDSLLRISWSQVLIYPNCVLQLSKISLLPCLICCSSSNKEFTCALLWCQLRNKGPSTVNAKLELHFPLQQNGSYLLYVLNDASEELLTCNTDPFHTDPLRVSVPPAGYSIWVIIHFQLM